MLRYIKLFIASVVMIALVLVAVANRQLVTVKLLPDPIADALGLGYQVTLPHFIILIVAVIVGLLLGYLIEWLRERKHRKAVDVKSRQLSRLESEVEQLKKKTGEEDDEILALLN